MRIQKQFVFCTIKGSAIKSFVILELVTGTGIYYAVKIISSSVIIAMVGSMIGTKGIKKAQDHRKKLNKDKVKSWRLTPNLTFE